MIVEIILIGLALVVILIISLAFINILEEQKIENKVLKDTLRREGQKNINKALANHKTILKNKVIIIYGIRIPSKYKSFVDFMNTQFPKNSKEHKIKLKIKAKERWLSPEYAKKMSKLSKNRARKRNGQFKKSK